LNYAVDLRYGVLVDLAQRIVAGLPIDVHMGHVNVIWQGDACAQVLQCLPLASSPPFVVNVTGGEVLPVRDVALTLGRLLGLGRAPQIQGTEAPDALLSDSSVAQSLFGAPSVSGERLLSWVAGWIGGGGVTLGKPTHFDEREGTF
jgi:hypothetical protein